MRLIDADALLKGKDDHQIISTHLIWNAPTVDAISLDTKIVVQMYDEEHEEWANEIMTIQELLESGMCEIYREELRDQYE